MEMNFIISKEELKKDFINMLKKQNPSISGVEDKNIELYVIIDKDNESDFDMFKIKVIK